MGRYDLLLGYVSKNIPPASIFSFDLETRLTKPGAFLSGERIIAVSCSYGLPEVKTELFVAEEETPEEEIRILEETDRLLRQIDPAVILGYNHTGYDIPLVQSKIKRLPYEKRLRNFEYYLGTAWSLDMMYVIADDLWKYDGDYYIRKLDDVVMHERYYSLPLMRKKSLARRQGMNKGDVIYDLWKNDRKSFEEYCKGDTSDLLLIFNDIAFSQ
ncbi:MAG: hypothetical protein M1151_03375 [Candidatus Thermoplasmatota archaeon]|jgi:DNA polymerase elongation subunit (family B)|nr:hypothetical protein [Candidatus Thermoplasmatota archaeon]MCL5785696.1 hypothetical protein [Candidatus Thermoplasmatota archaeon]